MIVKHKKECHHCESDTVDRIPVYCTLCIVSGTGIPHVSLSVERDTDSSPRLSNTGSSTDLNDESNIITRERAAKRK